MANEEKANLDLMDIATAIGRILDPLKPVFQAIDKVAQSVAPVAEAITPLIVGFARYSKFMDDVRPTGWLPVHTLSIEFVEQWSNDTSLLEAKIGEFYRNNWESIRQEFEDNLDSYQIADETRSTFLEALAVHESGHYRCVCCVLFPAIERELRFAANEISTGSMASNKKVKGFANRGSLEEMLPGEAHSWILFGRLVGHLYDDVNVGNIAQYEIDDVPNRHAALHGTIAYSRFKHSVNMLVMADYVFKVVSSRARAGSS